jgi:hypothetical protein
MGLLEEDDYVFKLLVAEAPVNHSEETIDSAVWITLPGDLEEFNRLANTLNEGCIQDCVYYEMKSAIPQITSDVFGNMYDFDLLHEIARQYAGMDTDEKMHYKAALSLADYRTLTGCKAVLDSLSEYGWNPDWDSLGDVGHQYATENMGLTADRASLANVDAIGWACMLGHYNCKITDYGTVWIDRDPQLFETPVDRQEEAGLYYSQTKDDYVNREDLVWEDMETNGNVHIGADFYCDQTDEFPTYLYYDTAIGVAWLELSAGTADSYHEDGEGDVVERCWQLAKAWGVHVCDSMEDYENLLDELGARMCDEKETEDQGMGGMT